MSPRGMYRLHLTAALKVLDETIEWASKGHLAVARAKRKDVVRSLALAESWLRIAGPR